MLPRSQVHLPAAPARVPASTLLTQRRLPAGRKVWDHTTVMRGPAGLTCTFALHVLTFHASSSLLISSKITRVITVSGSLMVFLICPFYFLACPLSLSLSLFLSLSRNVPFARLRRGRVRYTVPYQKRDKQHKRPNAKKILRSHAVGH
jgi:hypothetical protein